jgi:putative restriction endonuclease
VAILTREAEEELRERLMRRLSAEVDHSGGFLTRSALTSFDMGDGTYRRLVDSSKGIWNPAELSATLSIVSSPDGPYDDHDVDGGLFRYDYRAGSLGGDNIKLRRAYELGLPIILLRKIAAGVFVPVFPVYVIGDDQDRRQFIIAVDESLRMLHAPAELSGVERRYAEQITRRRLHQAMFRGMVVRAYKVRCAVCRLAHGDLLDAAHIAEDSEETGLAIVTNGLCLCKLHHAAYDRDLLGIAGDYKVQINKKLLDEVDGPMLQYGLQAMHGTTISIPATASERPDPDRLAVRFERFRIR